MKKLCLLFFVLLLAACLGDSAFMSNRNNKASRRKRYVVFPEGSSFSVALCMTATIVIPNNIFTEGLNWGVSYNLPNDSRSDPFTHPPAVLMRRRKRELFHNLEVVFDAMGIDGKNCIYRTLCEATQRFVKGRHLIEELLRILFKYPLEAVLSHEPEEHRLYHRAHRAGREKRDCSEMYPSCPISILSLVLGEYN